MTAATWDVVQGTVLELEGSAPVVITTGTSRRAAEDPIAWLSFTGEETDDEADVYGCFDPADAKSFVLPATGKTFSPVCLPAGR